MGGRVWRLIAIPGLGFAGAFWPPSALLAAAVPCLADTVIMKSGVVYRSMGQPDRDNTLVYISDGLKRIGGARLAN